ncbi:MAG: class I SAM-dependent methyltransferase [Actinomycetota bacterium]|nr:class I SAM-dependent methyltransferase [Actinomycetota bacterium]
MVNRQKIAPVLSDVIAPGLPLAIEAHDGSRAGPADAVCTLRINDPRALNYVATAPSDLGLARAYVAGYLDLDGDMFTALMMLAGDHIGSLSWADRLQVLRGLGPQILRPIAPPPEETRPGLWWGLRHSLQRDSKAIGHHYDVSNRFYEWLLGPTMAYTCAVYPYEGATLEEAQEEKVDLVCRKLDLRPGQRLLDVGCGWGTMVVHAAANYGVKVLGVTLSRQQAEWGQKRIAEMGLSDVAEIRHEDYRNVTESGFDAISSIGLTEHIGARNLAPYVAFLAGKVRAQGRFLNHCITRPITSAPARTGGFINRYVFPDGELEAVGSIISAIQDHGFEVRHEENLREHYARTWAPGGANLDAHWDEAVAEVGQSTARVWRLYLAASRLGFTQRRIELHQVLAVRTDERGSSGMPVERLEWGRRRSGSPMQEPRVRS